MNIRLRSKMVMAFAIGCMFVAGAQQQDDDIKRRITEAVMNVYNEELQKNPDDYESLCGRANQYFVEGDYLRALDDVDRAITLTPTKEKELRFEELMLRAKIYDIRNEQEKRLADLSAAHTIDPSHINCLGLLAQANYDLAKYDDAEQCYNRILRLQPNNYDAMAGLARVEVQRKNYGKAAEYADRAVKLYPAEQAVFVNRAEVLIMMEQYQAAAQDLISALSVGKDNGDVIESLVMLSDVQYDAVMDALNNSITKAPRNGMFYYIASKVAMAHNHYADAEYFFNLINSNKLYEYHGIYADLAKAQYCLGKYNDALGNVNTAIRACTTEAAYYVTRAMIQRALGKNDDALSSAKLAVATNADYVPALIEQARDYIALGKNNEALTSLNMAMVNDSESAEATLLRAWLYGNRLNKPADAKRDYARLLLKEDDITSRRGFALLAVDRGEEAAKWAAAIIEKGVMPGGEPYYVAACLMAKAGDKVKAMQYLTSALANGYGNYHNLTRFDDVAMNISSLKGEELNTLLKQYDKVFKAKRLTSTGESK